MSVFSTCKVKSIGSELWAALLTWGWTWLIVFCSGCRGGWSSECPEQIRTTRGGYNLSTRSGVTQPLKDVLSGSEQISEAVEGNHKMHIHRPVDLFLKYPTNWAHTTTFVSFSHRIITVGRIKAKQFKANRVALLNDNNILLESDRNKTNQCDQAAEVHQPNPFPDDTGGQN